MHNFDNTKPKSSGGLAFVNVTTETGKKQPLLECDKLEETLLEYSRTHFAQAEGSKFTQEPLCQLLQYNRLTPFGDHVTQGKPICTLHKFDELTQAILMNLYQKTPATPLENSTLNYTMLLQGIKKWLECMTTSPSNTLASTRH